jgi:hypothetical protein
MIPSVQRQEIMNWQDAEPSLKVYYNPPIGPNFTDMDIKLKFYERSEQMPFYDSISLVAMDVKLGAIVDRMYMLPSIVLKCDLTDENNYKRLTWGLRMRGAETVNEIECAFTQVNIMYHHCFAMAFTKHCLFDVGC